MTFKFMALAALSLCLTFSAHAAEQKFPSQARIKAFVEKVTITRVGPGVQQHKETVCIKEGTVDFFRGETPNLEQIEKNLSSLSCPVQYNGVSTKLYVGALIGLKEKTFFPGEAQTTALQVAAILSVAEGNVMVVTQQATILTRDQTPRPLAFDLINHRPVQWPSVEGASVDSFKTFVEITYDK